MTRHLAGRLYLHAACSRTFFYLPVMLLHIAGAFEGAGYGRSHAGAMAVLSLFALGLAISEFPSGVFADWAGRVRSMQVAAVVFAAGMLLYCRPEQVWLLAVGQLLLGLGAGFLSGSDTALLHHALELEGRGGEYGTKLAWLRFWNAVGLITGALAGGFLWVWWWPSVFLATLVTQVIGAVAVGGIPEPPRPHRDRGYWQVLGDALRHARQDRALAAMIAVSSFGVAVLSFCTWLIQGQLRDAGHGPIRMGLAMALWGGLSAASQRISAWVGRTPERSARTWPGMLLALPATLAAVALAHEVGLDALATLVLVATAAAFGIYRNATNVQVQMLVPDAVRASLVSLQSWSSSMWYLAIFPGFGWCLDAAGPTWGYVWMALCMTAAVWPMLLLAKAAGVFRSVRATARD